MSPVDCLVVGYYEWDFERVVAMTEAMGTDSGPYRDLRLAYVDVDGKPYRAMDLINHFRFLQGDAGPSFHNYDFLWPAVAYLVTFLHRRGLEADYVNLPHLEWGQLRDKLARSPRSVAINTTHVIAPEPAKELVQFVRQHSPESKIILGGPFVFGQAESLDEASLDEMFGYLGADVYVISRAGEGALARLVQTIKSGGSLFDVPNLAFRDAPHAASSREKASERLQHFLQQYPERKEALKRRLRRGTTGEASHPVYARYVRTPIQMEDHELAENRIDYDLFPREVVGSFVSLWTSKSCPFACSFCGFPKRGGPYRYLSAEQITRDLDKLHSLGVRNLTFVDDTFNVPKDRFKQLLRSMIRKNYGFRWNCFYRCDHGDAETVQLMREAGCEAVFLGIESGSDEILALMNKTARRKDYLRAIPILRDSGILTHANFIVGFPGETAETVRESFSLIEESRPHTYRAQLWYYDPVTPIHESRRRFGLRGGSFSWEHDTMNARQAADWVDEMFLSVEGATWLPQHSFEQWGILYLESKGWVRETIFEYMRAFNAMIKDRMRSGRCGDDRARLIADLVRRSSGHGQPS